MLEVVLRKIDLGDITCRNVSYPLMIIKPYMTPFIVHFSILLDILTLKPCLPLRYSLLKSYHHLKYLRNLSHCHEHFNEFNCI